MVMHIHKDTEEEELENLLHPFTDITLQRVWWIVKESDVDRK